MSIKIGNFVIINECDSPCGRHIAIVEKITDGYVHAKYISKDVHMEKCRGPIANCTNVDDFGVKIQFGYNRYLACQVRKSIATYHDGKHRNWQDSSEVWRETK